MPIVLNRWNRKWYTVLKVKGRSVTLQREDKSTFTIDKKELFANYTDSQNNEELEKLFEKLEKVVDKLN